jgi:integrase
MAMIYKVRWKRKSGEISQRWCLEWTNEKREKRRKLFASALDAKRHRRLIENSGAPFEETQISFAKAADDFIESRRNLGRERSTYDMYERQVRMHLGPLIGARDVRLLRRADFVKLQEDLVAKLSRSLARSVFMTAKSVMAHVVRREWREGDPTTGLRFDLSSREKARIDAPRKSDIQALLDALGGNEIAAGAPPTRGYVFVRLALGSGLRASELDLPPSERSKS